MFKRVIWMGTGAVVGAGGAFWAKRKVERTVERYLPEQVARRVGASSRDLSRTVRAAATEGRDAMRATEAELRARVDERTFVGPTEPGAAPGGPEVAVGQVIEQPPPPEDRPPPSTASATTTFRRRSRR